MNTRKKIGFCLLIIPVIIAAFLLLVSIDRGFMAALPCAFLLGAWIVMTE